MNVNDRLTKDRTVRISPQQQQTGLAQCAKLRALLAKYKTRREVIRANFQAEQDATVQQEVEDTLAVRAAIVDAALKRRGLGVQS